MAIEFLPKNKAVTNKFFDLTIEKKKLEAFHSISRRVLPTRRNAVHFPYFGKRGILSKPF